VHIEGKSEFILDVQSILIEMCLMLSFYLRNNQSRIHQEDQLNKFSVEFTMGEILFYNNKLKFGCRFATTEF